MGMVWLGCGGRALAVFCAPRCTKQEVCTQERGGIFLLYGKRLMPL